MCREGNEGEGEAVMGVREQKGMEVWVNGMGCRRDVLQEKEVWGVNVGGMERDEGEGCDRWRGWVL